MLHFFHLFIHTSVALQVLQQTKSLKSFIEVIEVIFKDQYLEQQSFVFFPDIKLSRRNVSCTFNSIKKTIMLFY